MISVLTGDIINSREAITQGSWNKNLKKALTRYGKTPKVWEIYRGDSFQLEIKKPEESFWAAVYIKAQIRSIKNVDVRIAIGLGEKTFDAARITESNGPAFINSGEIFEDLKNIKQNLAIKSPWNDLDTELNLMISLALIVMDKWTPSSAALIALSMENENLSQKELAAIIKRQQSSVSESHSRAHFNKIVDLENYYRKRIKQKLKNQ